LKICKQGAVEKFWVGYGLEFFKLTKVRRISSLTLYFSNQFAFHFVNNIARGFDTAKGKTIVVVEPIFFFFRKFSY